jgi:capsular exopolysaccharide synthesis family protein
VDTASTPNVPDLLSLIHRDTQTTRDATLAPLLKCQRVELRQLGLPILITSNSDAATHSAFESYRSLRTKIIRLQASQGIRSVAISSAVAGEGKTISALNLAISLAQLGTQRVLIVDGDIRTAGLSNLTGVTGRPGLGEVLKGQSEFAKAVVSTNISELYAVGAGEPTSLASDLYAAARWKEFIAWCNETFNMVIVDCPPVLGLADFDLISAACDSVVLVVRAHKTKRDMLVSIAKHIEGKKVLGVILNGEEHRHANYYGYYYYAQSRGNGQKNRQEKS